MVVQEHLVGIAADLALVAHRDHLAALGVVAEAGRIRHADELVVHRVAHDLQRLRHQRAQQLATHFDALDAALGGAVGVIGCHGTPWRLVVRS